MGARRQRWAALCKKHGTAKCVLYVCFAPVTLTLLLLAFLLQAVGAVGAGIERAVKSI